MPVKLVEELHFFVHVRLDVTAGVVPLIATATTGRLFFSLTHLPSVLTRTSSGRDPPPYLVSHFVLSGFLDLEHRHYNQGWTHTYVSSLRLQ